MQIQKTAVPETLQALRIGRRQKEEGLYMYTSFFVGGGMLRNCPVILEKDRTKVLQDSYAKH